MKDGLGVAISYQCSTHHRKVGTSCEIQRVHFFPTSFPIQRTCHKN